MKSWIRFCILIASLGLLVLPGAKAQVGGGAPIAYLYCLSGSAWSPCAAGNPLPVTPSSPSAGTYIGNVGGYDSGPVKATCSGSPCVANSSHAAGTSIGGLFTMALARINGGSGILTSLGYVSPGASTGQAVLRGWTKSPSSTCTDNVAFSNNTADDPYLIPGTPVTITPSAPASTTGDARTYASLTSLTWDYKNVDTSPSQNIYWCLVTVATDTADQNSSPILTGSGTQN